MTRVGKLHNSAAWAARARRANKHALWNKLVAFVLEFLSYSASYMVVYHTPFMLTETSGGQGHVTDHTPLDARTRSVEDSAG